MEKLYKYSEILEIQTEGDFAVLHNIITKERFKITLKSASIMSYLEGVEDFTYENLQKKFLEIEKNELRKFFEFLIAKRFVHEIADDPKILTIKPVFSLFNYDVRDLLDIEHSTVILGIPFGKGNTINEETFLYPDKIRGLTNKYGIKDVTSKGICDVGNIYFYENEYSFISYSKIEKIVEILSNKNNKIFSLGGDHSITFPIVKSLALKNKKINIIHFDAHTDYYKSSIHDLHEKHNFCSHHHGNFLQKILELENVNKIYQFGIRSLKEERKHPSKKVELFRNIEIKEFISSLKNIDKSVSTYISFDIDIIDPHYAPATATPVINGLNINDIFYVLDKLNENNINIIGIDIVEINPNKDIGGITMQLSVQLIQKLITLIT